MLIVDNLEVSKAEFRYVLECYKKNKKDFKKFKDNNVALTDYISDLVRDYRTEHGYIAPVKVRLRLGK